MAADEPIQVIVVDIPDRLGRGDAISKLELLAEMNGARVEYVTPGRDKSTVEGIAMAATDQLVSGIERLSIRRRTVKGKMEWAKRGRIIMAALRPYGSHHCALLIAIVCLCYLYNHYLHKCSQIVVILSHAIKHKCDYSFQVHAPLPVDLVTVWCEWWKH